MILRLETEYTPFEPVNSNYVFEPSISATRVTFSAGVAGRGDSVVAVIVLLIMSTV